MIPRRSERGIALAMAMILAVLYFGLIQLLLVDSSRELGAARRFRARVLAQTMAENGAELAAHDLVAKVPGAIVRVTAEDAMGTTTGELRKASDVNFVLEGKGQTKGLVVIKESVTITGRVVGNRIYIDYTTH